MAPDLDFIEWVYSYSASYATNEWITASDSSSTIHPGSSDTSEMLSTIFSDSSDSSDRRLSVSEGGSDGSDASRDFDNSSNFDESDSIDPQSSDHESLEFLIPPGHQDIQENQDNHYSRGSSDSTGSPSILDSNRTTTNTTPEPGITTAGPSQARALELPGRFRSDHPQATSWFSSRHLWGHDPSVWTPVGTFSWRNRRSRRSFSRVVGHGRPLPAAHPARPSLNAQATEFVPRTPTSVGSSLETSAQTQVQTHVQTDVRAQVQAQYQAQNWVQYHAYHQSQLQAFYQFVYEAEHRAHYQAQFQAYYQYQAHLEAQHQAQERLRAQTLMQYQSGFQDHRSNSKHTSSRSHPRAP